MNTNKSNNKNNIETFIKALTQQLSAKYPISTEAATAIVRTSGISHLIVNEPQFVGEIGVEDWADLLWEEYQHITLDSANEYNKFIKIVIEECNKKQEALYEEIFHR